MQEDEKKKAKEIKDVMKKIRTDLKKESEFIGKYQHQLDEIEDQFAFVGGKELKDQRKKVKKLIY